MRWVNNSVTIREFVDRLHENIPHALEVYGRPYITVATSVLDPVMDCTILVDTVFERANEITTTAALDS